MQEPTFLNLSPGQDFKLQYNVRLQDFVTLINTDQNVTQCLRC